MKKLILSLFSVILVTVVAGQETITVNVTSAGGFSSALAEAGGSPSSVTNLTITGNINRTDIDYIRVYMNALSVLDLGTVNIEGNTMPNSAFLNKTTLTTIKLPSTLVTIDIFAFSGCTGLTCALTIPDAVRTIRFGSFKNCSGLTGNLIFPNSVDTIGDMAFSGCSGLNGSLTISSSVVYIGAYAFENCSGITGNLTIPESVKYIGYYAFHNCSALTGSLSILGSIEIIGNYAFYGCNGLSGTLTIPNSVTSIGEGAFRDCIGFTGLILPSSLKDINNYAFYSCSGFNGSLSIPDSVYFIGSSAFKGCSGFTGGITIPSSITSIYSSTFEDCSGFTGTLILPNTIKSIGAYAFNNCGFTGDLVIPSSVTSIGEYAFQNCSGLTGSLTLSSSIATIPNSAFYNCKFTGTLSIPNSVTSIAYYAFGNCSGFKGDLIIPNSVTSVAANAFRSCSGFTSIFIPNSLSTFKSTFIDCSGVQKISVNNSTPPTIDQYTFNGINKTTCSLIVPVGAMATYQSTEYWKDFTNISEAIFVIFDSQGGSIVSAVNTTAGSTIMEPTKPTRAGYTFADWYKEAECTNKWDFASDVVTSNITLYAKWTLNYYSVSFNTQGGSSISSIYVNYGTIISVPESPTRIGYIFKDWYNNPECLYVWDFEVDKIISDTVLYAKWITNSYIVSFNTQGGSLISDVSANYNTTITEPTAPTLSGFIFAGWYKEAECINEWGFTNDTIVSDTILFAKWTSEETLLLTSSSPLTKLYPNPAKDFITIKGENIQQIIVQDLSGKVLIHLCPNEKNNCVLDLSNLKSGSYLIYIRKQNYDQDIIQLLKK